MPFIELRELDVREPRPGWSGRFFHSEHMTFAHYVIEAGAFVPPHHHPSEEVWSVLEGELELTLDGVTRVLGPEEAAVVPASAEHSVRALTGCRAIVVDHAVRTTVGGVEIG